MSTTGMRSSAFIGSLGEMTDTPEMDSDCASIPNFFANVKHGGIARRSPPMPGLIQTVTYHGAGDHQCPLNLQIASPGTTHPDPGLPRVAADDEARRQAHQPRIDTAGSISPDDAWEGGGAFIVEINGEDIDSGTTAPALRF